MAINLVQTPRALRSGLGETEVNERVDLVTQEVHFFRGISWTKANQTGPEEAAVWRSRSDWDSARQLVAEDRGKSYNASGAPHACGSCRAKPGCQDCGSSHTCDPSKVSPISGSHS